MARPCVSQAGDAEKLLLPFPQLLWASSSRPSPDSHLVLEKGFSALHYSTLKTSPLKPIWDSGCQNGGTPLWKGVVLLCGGKSVCLSQMERNCIFIRVLGKNGLHWCSVFDKWLPNECFPSLSRIIHPSNRGERKSTYCGQVHFQPCGLECV